MQILRSIEELAAIKKPLVLAAGVFDGVHPGHQAVLQTAQEAAKRIHGVAVVLTFDPHPATILRPANVPKLLTSTDYKLRLIEALGIKSALVVRFDADFAAMKAEDFINKLCESAHHLAGICIGEGWVFGHERKGDSRLLRIMGMKNGFFTSEVTPVKIDDTLVSSTLIRQAISEGNLPRAAELLGRDHSVSGTVLEGKKLGRDLGFPTANLETHNEQFPPDGVYAVRATVNDDHYNGVANIGIRPTVSGEGSRILEVHLFDFSGDLYGKTIDVAFLQFLRPEQKFENLDALRAQIQHDAAEARDWIDQHRKLS